MDFLIYLIITIVSAFLVLVFLSFCINKIILFINQKHFLKIKPELLKKYYLASLHCHSYYDDALTVKEIIINAYKNKYSFFSITDHLEPKLSIDPSWPFAYLKNLIKKGKTLCGLSLKLINNHTIKVYNKKVPDSHVMYLIQGVEISAVDKNKKTHLGIVGLNKMPRPYHALDYYFKEYQKENVLIIACHPFSPNKQGMGLSNLEKYKKRIDFVELNGSFPLPFGYFINNKTKNVAKNLDIPIIANTDAHIKSNYFNTFSSLIPKSTGFDENNIVDYIKKHRKSIKAVMCYPPIIRIYLWIFKGLFFKKKVPKEFKIKIKK
jgi:predicted metal-dependent phosphoesterase TrpH